MAHVKRGVTAHARHKKVLKLAKGYRGRAKDAFRVAIEKVEKGLRYAYRDRRAARLALFRRKRAQPLQQAGDLAVAAERADANLLEHVGPRCRRDLTQPLLADLVEAFHRRRPLGLSERRLCLSYDRLKRLRLTSREISQHLAVELDPGALQAVDELRIGQAAFARARIDALNPEGAEIALLRPPVAIGVAQALLDLLDRDAEARLRAAANWRTKSSA